jgi:hypothetical protein
MNTRNRSKSFHHWPLRDDVPNRSSAPATIFSTVFRWRSMVSVTGMSGLVDRAGVNSGRPAPSYVRTYALGAYIRHAAMLVVGGFYSPRCISIRHHNVAPNRDA